MNTIVGVMVLLVTNGWSPIGIYVEKYPTIEECWKYFESKPEIFELRKEQKNFYNSTENIRTYTFKNVGSVVVSCKAMNG